MNDPLIKGGYIILSRKTIESEIFKKPPLYLKVWIYLLSIAQHKEYKKLKRGQLVTSIPEIQEACCHYIGYRKVKPTRDQIYNILEWLRKGCEAVHESDTNTMTDTTMITTTKATQGMLINIDNYNVYQEPKNYESNNESNAESNNEKVTKATSKQRQDDNINKNDKNYKNDKKYIYISEFTENKKLLETIIDFMKMRDSIKKPMTDKAIKLMLGKLNKYSMVEEMQIKILERSILNNWSDVYELKEDNNGNGVYGTKPNIGQAKKYNIKPPKTVELTDEERRRADEELL